MLRSFLIGSTWGSCCTVPCFQHAASVKQRRYALNEFAACKIQKTRSRSQHQVEPDCIHLIMAGTSQDKPTLRCTALYLEEVVGFLSVSCAFRTFPVHPAHLFAQAQPWMPVART